MNKGTENWLKSALYDLETAEHMFSTRRYIYTVFMCHLALEKILKAMVEQTINTSSPRSHDLLYLVHLGGIVIPEDKLQFLSRLANVSVATRYPEDFDALFDKINSSNSKEILSQTKEFFGWIQKQLK